MMVVEVCTMRSDRRHQTNIAISSWTVACIEWYDALTALRRPRSGAAAVVTAPVDRTRSANRCRE